MTVLPQLERELRAAHSRPRRPSRFRRPVTAFAAAAAAAAVVAVIVVAAGIGQDHRVPPERTSSGWTQIVLRHVNSLQVYASGGSLYLGEAEINGRPPKVTLVRLDPSTGTVLARIPLGSLFGGAVIADGSLWVTGTTYARSSSSTTLWRLDPRSLAVLARLVLPRGIGYSDAGSIALAGGGLWISDTDRLIRVSLPSGRISAQHVLAGVDGLLVFADPSGRILLDSVGDGSGRGQVQRRNPVTGALIASSAPFEGASQPAIGGVIDGGIWFSEAGGMMGHVGRLSLATLRPTRADVPQIATNGIGAQVIDGILWISQPAGGAQRNYCGDPATGRSLAPLISEKLTNQISFLTADAHYVYLERDVGPRSVTLRREAISARCR